MSDFVRPEFRAALARYAQVIIGALIVALGLWWTRFTFGIVNGLSYGVALLGLIIAIEGLRRARLMRKATGKGPGLVEVDEWRITYLSAHFGGSVAIDALMAVEIQVTDQAEALWIFLQTDGQRLVVPASAKGADLIVDALSALPGLDYAAAQAAMASTDRGRFVLWRTDQSRIS